jgi:hypothetical protein
MEDSATLDVSSRLVLTETLGSVLWFFMDGFWMLSLASAAKWMIFPTVAVNLFVFRYTRPLFSQLAVVAAMNSWLGMNIFWMISDLDRDPKPLGLAKMMFALGIVFLILAVGRNVFRPRSWGTVLMQFRRLRM